MIPQRFASFNAEQAADLGELNLAHHLPEEVGAPDVEFQLVHDVGGSSFSAGLSVAGTGPEGSCRARCIGIKERQASILFGIVV